MPQFRLPLVSVIVVNYNYGRYLEGAVRSIQAQTYPHVECIVVDNASTDESSVVLEHLSGRDPNLKIFRRSANDGQTPASLDGLAASSGAYVIFVDADDILLPHCIDCHMLAHLSMRTPVGFTSGDMLQIVDDQVIVSTGEAFSDYIRMSRKGKTSRIRPVTDHGLNWPSADLRERVESRVHFVPPLSTQWIWSPTSGNCYRRDALLMFADNAALAHLRTGTDMYFARSIGALCGSALIDESVFGYRIHGGNIYSRRAQLNRTLPYTPGGHGDSNDIACALIVDHLTAFPRRFAPTGWLSLHLAHVMVRLDVSNPDRNGPRWKRRSRLATRLVEHAGALKASLSAPLLAALMFWSGVPLATMIRALRTKPVEDLI